MLFLKAAFVFLFFVGEVVFAQVLTPYVLVNSDNMELEVISGDLNEWSIELGDEVLGGEISRYRSHLFVRNSQGVRLIERNGASGGQLLWDARSSDQDKIILANIVAIFYDDIMERLYLLDRHHLLFVIEKGQIANLGAFSLGSMSAEQILARGNYVAGFRVRTKERKAPFSIQVEIVEVELDAYVGREIGRAHV